MKRKALCLLMVLIMSAIDVAPICAEEEEVFSEIERFVIDLGILSQYKINSEGNE